MRWTSANRLQRKASQIVSARGPSSCFKVIGLSGRRRSPCLTFITVARARSRIDRPAAGAVRSRYAARIRPGAAGLVPLRDDLRRLGAVCIASRDARRARDLGRVAVLLSFWTSEMDSRPPPMVTLMPSSTISLRRSAIAGGARHCRSNDMPATLVRPAPERLYRAFALRPAASLPSTSSTSPGSTDAR